MLRDPEQIERFRSVMNNNLIIRGATGLNPTLRQPNKTTKARGAYVKCTPYMHNESSNTYLETWNLREDVKLLNWERDTKETPLDGRC